jgi:hypothetical protein
VNSHEFINNSHSLIKRSCCEITTMHVISFHYFTPKLHNCVSYYLRRKKNQPCPNGGYGNELTLQKNGNRIPEISDIRVLIRIPQCSLKQKISVYLRMLFNYDYSRCIIVMRINFFQFIEYN